MPSVLFINRVHPPDPGATGLCLAELAHGLAARGWAVTVVTEGTAVDVAGPVRVVRTGTGIDSEGPRGVAAYAASLGRLMRAALRQPPHDVVVALSDPPLLALAGWVVARARGSAVVHWCHDFYPPLLPVVAPRLPGLAVRMATVAARLCLNRHDAVVAIGRCMIRRMEALGLSSERLRLIPNWAEPGIRDDPEAGAAFRRAHGLEGRFVVLYAGNLGLVHPLDAVIAAARDVPDNVVFVIAGQGRGRAALERVARGISSILFLPWQPEDRLPGLLAAADLHVVAMDERAAGLLVPRKAAAALAAGKPCLFLGPADCEAALRIAERGCGLVLPPGDGAALSAVVRAYCDDSRRREREGRAALTAAAEWTAGQAVERFDALLADLIHTERPDG